MDEQQITGPQTPADVLFTRLNRSVIDGLFMMMHCLGTYGESHPTTLDAAKSMGETLAKAGLPISLQFVGDAVFRDGEFVPFGTRGHAHVLALRAALGQVGVSELSFSDPPSGDDLLRLGVALSSGEPGTLDGLEPRGFKWRKLPGTEMQALDPEVYVSTQVALAIEGAEKLAAGIGEPWDGSLALSVIRQLLRVQSTDQLAGHRAIEIGLREWTPARRAVAATFRALSSLTALGVSPGMIRAVAHCVLACSSHGLRDRGGLAVGKAAESALRAYIEREPSAVSGVTPHRLRVCAMMYRIKSARSIALLGAKITGLVHLCYELERRRCPPHESFDLTFADLLAQAVEISSTGAPGTTT